MAKAKDDGENAKKTSALEEDSEAKQKDENGENADKSSALDEDSKAEDGEDGEDDKKDEDDEDAKKPSPRKEGIKAGGIIGLFFAVAFLWAGYAPLVSWALGAIGGLAGGLIFGWWQITEEPKQALVFEKRKTLAEATRERSAKQKKDTQGTKTTARINKRPKVLGLFEKLFGKKDSETGSDK